MPSKTTDIYFYCTNPACRRRLRSSPQFVGRKVQCTRCPTKIVVPAASQLPAPKAPPPAAPAPANPVNFFDQDEFEKWLNDPTAPVPDDSLPFAEPVVDDAPAAKKPAPRTIIATPAAPATPRRTDE